MMKKPGDQFFAELGQVVGAGLHCAELLECLSRDEGMRDSKEFLATCSAAISSFHATTIAFFLTQPDS